MKKESLFHLSYLGENDVFQPSVSMSCFRTEFGAFLPPYQKKKGFLCNNNSSVLSCKRAKCCT